MYIFNQEKTKNQVATPQLNKYQHSKPIQFNTSLLRIAMVFIIFSIHLLQTSSQIANAYPQQKDAQVLGTILTVGGTIIAGKSISNELQEIVDETGNVANETIANLKKQIDDTVTLLEETYQDNLAITIESLDNVSQKKIQEFLQTLDRVDSLIKDNVDYAEASVQRVIEDASLEIQLINADLEKRINDFMLVFIRGSVYLIDRVVFNTILIISIIAIGIGLLLFIWLLFQGQKIARNRRLLLGIFMLSYLAFFGALVIPNVRFNIIVFTRFGLEEQLLVDSNPNIISVRPNKIVIGETKEIEVIGENLLLNDDVQPAATIGNLPVAIKADTNGVIVLDTDSLNLSSGLTEIGLIYPDGTRVDEVVEIELIPEPVAPADLLISAISTSPSKPKVGDSVQIQVTVENRGETDGHGFIVELKPFSAQTAGNTQTIGKLAAGASKTLLYSYVYRDEGTYTIVGGVDLNNVIPESNEANNITQQTIRIDRELDEEPPQIPSYPFINSTYRFYEDNNGGGDLVCKVVVTPARINGFTVNFTKSEACDNDESRSLALVKVPAGTRITVYDNSACSTNDDWTVITVKKDVKRYIVPTFESDFEDTFVKTDYKTSGNLDGKVSCIRVTPP